MNNRIFSLIIGVVLVVVFWIGWVSLNPSDKKAMAQFISVENLLSDNLSQRLKLGGIVKDGSISISESNWLYFSINPPIDAERQGAIPPLVKNATLGMIG